MNEETSANTVVVIEHYRGAVVQRIVGEWVAELPRLPAHRYMTARGWATRCGAALRSLAGGESCWLVRYDRGVDCVGECSRCKFCVG